MALHVFIPFVLVSGVVLSGAAIMAVTKMSQPTHVPSVPIYTTDELIDKVDAMRIELVNELERLQHQPQTDKVRKRVRKIEEMLDDHFLMLSKMS